MEKMSTPEEGLSVGAKSGKEQQGQGRTPTKMYSFPNTGTTPVKENTPEKLEKTYAEKDEPKLKRNDLNFIKEKITAFCVEMDTEIKACLYSVSVNDTADTKKGLERLRRKGKAFEGQIGFSINQCTQRSTALIQQVKALENSNLHLHREKLDLLGEIKKLKNQRDVDKLMSQEEQAEIDKLLQSDDEM